MNTLHIAEAIQANFKKEGVFSIDGIFGVGKFFEVWADVRTFDKKGKRVEVGIYATQRCFMFKSLEGGDYTTCAADNLAFNSRNAIAYELDYAEFLALTKEEQIEKLMPLAEQIHNQRKEVAHTIADECGLRAWC